MTSLNEAILPTSFPSRSVTIEVETSTSKTEPSLRAALNSSVSPFALSMMACTSANFRTFSPGNSSPARMPVASSWLPYPNMVKNEGLAYLITPSRAVMMTPLTVEFNAS